MSAAYASRYKAVFLCLHPKGSKMSYGAAAKYIKKSKTFVSKVKRYSDVKNIDDLPNRGSTSKKTMKKEDKMILWFEKNPCLPSRGGQAVLRKKGLNISCDTTRRHLLTHEAKFRSTVKKLLLPKKHIKKKIHLGERIFRLRRDKVMFLNKNSFWARSSIHHI